MLYLSPYNIIPTIASLVGLWLIEVTFLCTGVYTAATGYPLTPISLSTIPAACAGNFIAGHRWIYVALGITIYVLASLITAHFKQKDGPKNNTV